MPSFARKATGLWSLSVAAAMAACLELTGRLRSRGGDGRGLRGIGISLDGLALLPAVLGICAPQKSHRAVSRWRPPQETGKAHLGLEVRSCQRYVVPCPDAVCADGTMKSVGRVKSPHGLRLAAECDSAKVRSSVAPRW